MALTPQGAIVVKHRDPLFDRNIIPHRLLHPSTTARRAAPSFQLSNTPVTTCFPASLLAHQHGLGFAFEVAVGLAADVDGDALDRAARKGQASPG